MTKSTVILFFLLATLGSSAAGALVHAGAAVSVPVDSPWALGALGALVTVVVARVIKQRKD